MKSKQQMQKVVLALSMVIGRPDIASKKLTDEEFSKSKKLMDVLLWVMDYPNNFDTFANNVINKCPISDEELEEMFDESIEEYSKAIANQEGKGDSFSA